MSLCDAWSNGSCVRVGPEPQAVIIKATISIASVVLSIGDNPLLNRVKSGLCLGRTLHGLALDGSTGDRFRAVQLDGGLQVFFLLRLVRVVLRMHAESVPTDRNGDERKQDHAGFHECGVHGFWLRCCWTRRAAMIRSAAHLTQPAGKYSRIAGR